MVNPDSWSVISTGYNDNNNLLAPYPKVEVNVATHSGFNTWIGERTGGNGAAMFDAPLVYYTGVPVNNNSNRKFPIKIVPNPASEYTVIELDLIKNSDVELVLSNSLGKPLVKKSLSSAWDGKHMLKLDLADYSSGIYFITICTGSSLYSDKIIISK